MTPTGHWIGTRIEIKMGGEVAKGHLSHGCGWPKATCAKELNNIHHPFEELCDSVLTFLPVKEIK